jgi:signal transduction histidine kinase
MALRRDAQREVEHVRAQALAQQERARAAEQLAALRNDFVASVSHELRTPLAAVLGYAELLQERWDRLDDERRRTRIDRIVVAANRQMQLIEDLLHLSRVEATEPTSDVEPVRIADVVGRSADAVQGSYPCQKMNQLLYSSQCQSLWNGLTHDDDEECG